eukprot:TRINITY_DN6711_c0_g1_i1.p1 TRINITY_DN6711_c0_g1~~TRINITY_DN6711_c0_g1_i1.p1  ORF type:complete len:118 (+),score=16.98 TRINITY_DN6711_c0_g1_i1:35-355(+)
MKSATVTANFEEITILMVGRADIDLADLQEVEWLKVVEAAQSEDDWDGEEGEMYEGELYRPMTVSWQYEDHKPLTELGIEIIYFPQEWTPTVYPISDNIEITQWPC